MRRLKKFEYIDQEGKLTEKGVFSSKVYADEISLGEVFATPFVEQLDEEQILFVLAALHPNLRLELAFVYKGGIFTGNPGKAAFPLKSRKRNCYY